MGASKAKQQTCDSWGGRRAPPQQQQQQKINQVGPKQFWRTSFQANWATPCLQREVIRSLNLQRRARQVYPVSGRWVRHGILRDLLITHQLTLKQNKHGLLWCVCEVGQFLSGSRISWFSGILEEKDELGSHLINFLLVLEAFGFLEFYSSSASLPQLWLSSLILVITDIFLLNFSTCNISSGKISSLTKKNLPIILSLEIIQQ